MQRIECEELGTLIQDHMKREEKELIKMQKIDDELSFAIEDRDVKVLEIIRESHRQKVQIHRMMICICSL